MDSAEKLKLRSSILFSFAFVAFLWVVRLADVSMNLELNRFGLYPRTIHGLIGILFTPFLHGSNAHLFSNTIPLFILGIVMLYSYPKVAMKVFALSILVTGIGVWCFGRPSYHIGASGLVYTMVTFIFFSGIVRRERAAIALSLLVTLFYGGLVWGVLPLEEGISWESHLFGAVTGVVCAFMFRNIDRQIEPIIYDEAEEDDDFIPPEGWKPETDTHIRYIYTEKDDDRA